MDDQAAARKARKEEARRLKRKRIEEAGGVRPRHHAESKGEAESTEVVAATKDVKEGNDGEARPPVRTHDRTDPHQQQLRRKNRPRSMDDRVVGKGPQRSRHRFGGVMEKVPCPNRARTSTLSMAVPGSVVSNCQTRELRTQLVGQIARAAAVFHVDEIVVFDDKLSSKMRDRGSYHHRRPYNNDRRDRNGSDSRPAASTDGNDGGDKKENAHADRKEEERERSRPSDPHTFMARVLQYCECPQYLRRHFFPMHGDLQFAGLLAPLDAPHHVRAGERSKYREGVVLDKKGTDPDAGSLVNCGIRGRPVEIDRVLEAGIRCTVQLDPKSYEGSGRIKGTVVSPSAPREDNGTYWGYTTRLAGSIKAVFDESPYEGGYDLKIGTSERGNVTVDDRKFSLPRFRHMLIVFGGVAGIEECIDADETMTLSGKDAHKLFDKWVNTCPYQGSRTIRTEEAVLISLSRFRPHVAKNAEAPTTPKVFKDEDLQFSEDNLSEESSEDED